MKKVRGFTLVELLVVMGIMVMLTTIVVVAIGPFLKGKPVDSAISSFKAAAYSARFYAAMQHELTWIECDPVDGLMIVSTKNGRVRAPFQLPFNVTFIMDGGFVVRDASGVGKSNSITWGKLGNLDPLANGGTGSRRVGFVSTGHEEEWQEVEIAFITGLVRR